MRRAFARGREEQRSVGAMISRRPVGCQLFRQGDGLGSQFGEVHGLGRLSRPTQACDLGQRSGQCLSLLGGRDQSSQILPPVRAQPRLVLHREQAGQTLHCDEVVGQVVSQPLLQHSQDWPQSLTAGCLGRRCAEIGVHGTTSRSFARASPVASEAK